MMQDTMKGIRDGMTNAELSTTPFPVLDNGELAVVGDANKTEINKHDYTITFKVPSEEGGKMVYKTVKKEFKGVYITPRQEPKVIRLVTQLKPFIVKIKEDGGLENRTDEEILDIVTSFPDEIYELMYQLVTAVLNVNPALTDFMVAGDVMVAVGQIITNYPEMLNEADTFFG